MLDICKKGLLKNKTLFVFMLFFPHVYHIGFLNNDLWWIDYIVNRWVLVSFFVLTIVLFAKKNKPSLLLIVLGVTEAWALITTYLYNPDRLFKATLYVCSSISISVIIELYIDELKELLSALMFSLEIQIYPNLVSVFMFRNIDELTPGYNLNNYLLGTKNDLILYLMPAFCLSSIYLLKINKKSIRSIMLIFAVLLTVIFTNSTTTLISLLLSIMVFVYCCLFRKNKILSTYLIASVPLLAVVFVVLPYVFIGTNPLVDFIMKNIFYKHSFISRTTIWADASSYIADRIWTGYGYINQSLVFVDDVGRTYAGNAHCDLIQRLLNYGIVGLVLFCVFNLIIVYEVDKTKSHIIKSLFISFICGIYITFIAQDYHRFFELQIVFFLAYNIQKIINYKERIKLEPIKETDINSFYDLKCDNSNVYWTGWNNKPAYDIIVSFVKNVIENNISKKDRKIYIAKIGKNIIGYVYIDYVDDETYHISPAIDSKYQGKGYGKDIIKLAIEKGLELGFNKAEAYIREDNMASQKCFEYNGMHKTDAFEMKYIENMQKDVKMIRYFGEFK